MIQVNNLSKHFADKDLFKNINLKFTKGNNYGVIGANGAGKSTFLKILSGDMDAESGSISVEKNKRISVLEQDQTQYADINITDIVVGGDKRLFEIIAKKDEIYSRPDFSEQDGIDAGHLEEEFANMGGWESESNAQRLLSDLKIPKNQWTWTLKELEYSSIVKVLLARALFGNPDILIMDEPTNHLDLKAINWLEDFLKEYDNTLIIVSHDTEFLDRVCTNIVDIDFGSATMFSGNYSFWKESSELMLELQKKSNLKKEEQIKKLETFIARFSANAAHSSQATSRRKSLDKINIDTILPSTRQYPYINFELNREVGKQILNVENLSYVDSKGATLFSNLNFRVEKDEKIVLLGTNDIAKTRLLEILAGVIEPTTGTAQWGVTVTNDYLPLDSKSYFDNDLTLLQWISQWTTDNSDEKMRSFLGRMLFSADSVFKKVKVSSGGEQVRLMFARAMIRPSNFLIMDQPLEHLDVESIDSLISATKKYKSGMIFTTYNQKMINSVANVILEISSDKSSIYRGNPEKYINK